MTENRKKLYNIFNNINQRCFNQKYYNFKNYGGRGIIICNEWRCDFQAFYDWSIANGYKKGLTLDRIDNNGIYKPSNCRWTTQKEQCRNRRNNHLITYNEETHCLKEWAEKFNISQRVLLYRIRNWEKDRIFNKII